MYVPQFLQTLCGIIREPHFGHLTRVAAAIFQFALRLSLLPLDDLFFGQIDIEYTSLNKTLRIIILSVLCFVNKNIGQNVRIFLNYFDKSDVLLCQCQSLSCDCQLFVGGNKENLYLGVIGGDDSLLTADIVLLRVKLCAQVAQV